MNIVFLLLCLPFLQPIHYPPLGSFYDEWLAIVLGLLGVLALVARKELRLQLPRAVWLPGLIALATLLQLLDGQIGFHWLGYWALGYLLWAVALMGLAATLVRQYSRERLLRYLSGGLICGALLSALLALLQALAVELPLALMMPAINGNIYANIAQRNLFASYLWLAICALIYWHLLGRLNKYLLCAGLVLLCSALGLTASRLGYLHGLVLLGLVAWFCYRKPPPAGSTLFRPGVLLLLLACLGLQYAAATLYQHSGWAIAGWNQTAVERLGALAQGDARLAIWRHSLWAIQQHLWQGGGLGNYAWNTVLAAAAIPAEIRAFPGHEHAHNIVLQWLADYGLLWGALFVGLSLFWGVRVFRNLHTDAERLLFMWVSVLLVHSLLEYPLWYAEFLGPMALFVGALSSQQTYEIRLKRRVLVTGCGALLLVMGVLLVDYVRLSQNSFMNEEELTSKTVWDERIAEFSQIARDSVFKPYAIRSLINLMQVTDATTPQQAQLCLSTLHFSPNLQRHLKCVAMLRKSGEVQAADELEQLTKKAYRYRE